MVGANTEELRALGDVFSHEGDSARRARESLLSEIDSIEWIGDDRERYRERWRSGADAKIVALADVLDQLGSEHLPRQADEQDEASAASRGGEQGGDQLTSSKSEGEQNAYGTRVDDESKHTPHEGEVPTEEADIDPYDVNQRGIGDCWALASISALAQTEAGRQLLAENIRYDAESNSYLVTLYEDGEPVEVRVSNSFANGGDGGVEGAAGDDNQPNYASIYEKALAEHYGDNYGDIWGDDPARAMETITGKDVDEVGTDPFNPWAETADSDNIRERLDDGQAVTLSTPEDQPEGSPIIGNHVYTVTDVREDGSLVVYNPWGNLEGSTTEGLEQGELIIPADKIDEYFASMDAVKP